MYIDGHFCNAAVIVKGLTGEGGALGLANLFSKLLELLLSVTMNVGWEDICVSVGALGIPVSE